MKDDTILLAHGSGGRLSHQLIQDLFLPILKNPMLETLDDGCIINLKADKLVMTTDSYVVDPIFFPGGDIGKLAVSGTVNDLAVMGALPLFISLSFIIEEGFPVSDLKKILRSIRNTCETAQVQVVTGDTKVVQRGSADKIFINTTGIGELSKNFRINREIQQGDKVVINGTIGDHGTTIMAERDGLKMEGNLQSDCAPLAELIQSVWSFGEKIRVMRDPTRGGVATVLNEIVENHSHGIIINQNDIPVRQEVKGLCEILGLDPLYIANEGKVIMVVAPDAVQDLVRTLKIHPLGENASIIGEVTAQHPSKVVLKSDFGGKRVIDMLTGEQLPRIC